MQWARPARLLLVLITHHPRSRAMQLGHVSKDCPQPPSARTKKTRSKEAQRLTAPAESSDTSSDDARSPAARVRGTRDTCTATATHTPPESRCGRSMPIGSPHMPWTRLLFAGGWQRGRGAQEVRSRRRRCRSGTDMRKETNVNMSPQRPWPAVCWLTVVIPLVLFDSSGGLAEMCRH